MLRNQTDSIVIKPKMSSLARYALIVVPIIVFVLGVGAAYYHGLQANSGELEQAKKQLIEQSQRNEALSTRYEQIRESFAKLERQLHINDTAYSELRKDMELSNAKLTELNTELKFYRSIISPQDGKQGVRVQELAITPTEQAQTYRYKLVLIQTLQQENELSGTVGLTIKGEMDGQSQTIKHPAPGEKKMYAKFKYFQNFTGTLELPAAFKPLKVKVNLAVNRKKALIEDRWYSWPQVTGVKSS